MLTHSPWLVQRVEISKSSRCNLTLPHRRLPPSTLLIGRLGTVMQLPVRRQRPPGPICHLLPSSMLLAGTSRSQPLQHRFPGLGTGCAGSTSPVWSPVPRFTERSWDSWLPRLRLPRLLYVNACSGYGMEPSLLLWPVDSCSPLLTRVSQHHFTLLCYRSVSANLTNNHREADSSPRHQGCTEPADACQRLNPSLVDSRLRSRPARQDELALNGRTELINGIP